MVARLPDLHYTPHAWTQWQAGGWRRLDLWLDSSELAKLETIVFFYWCTVSDRTIVYVQRQQLIT